MVPKGALHAKYVYKDTSEQFVESAVGAASRVASKSPEQCWPDKETSLRSLYGRTAEEKEKAAQHGFDRYCWANKDKKWCHVRFKPCCTLFDIGQAQTGLVDRRLSKNRVTFLIESSTGNVARLEHDLSQEPDAAAAKTEGRKWTGVSLFTQALEPTEPNPVRGGAGAGHNLPPWRRRDSDRPAVGGNWPQKWETDSGTDVRQKVTLRPRSRSRGRLDFDLPCGWRLELDQESRTIFVHERAGVRSDRVPKNPEILDEVQFEEARKSIASFSSSRR